MTDKDPCRAKFKEWAATNPNQMQWANEEAWTLRGWQAAWSHQSAELAARDAEIARLRETISLAYEAMNHMGDILNAHDMAEPESVEQVAPAFEAVRAALSKPASAPKEPK